MKKVRKAVIPAAGLGTRFLPATKSLPKEMLPIVDTPNIQYIVKEAVNSGIESILIITSGAKSAIEDHFDYNYELEHRLREAGKEKEAREVHAIGDMADVFYVRQREPKGLGHAILCARDFIGDEPFAILLGDDLVVPGEGDEPAIKSLIDAYYKTNTTVVGVKKVAHEAISKYASVKIDDFAEGKTLFHVSDMIEKPKEGESFSDYGILGRYVATPDIFEILSHTAPGRNNEIQLTDALRAQAIKAPGVYAKIFPGTRYDIGDKFGYVKATVDFALKRPDIGPELLAYLKKILSGSQN